jgi:DNA replication and repair protein RecF
MTIAQLHIHHLRNISHAQLTLHPRFNIVYGANGSGKTSLLEAVYLLGTGHSFRTRDTSLLIQMDEPALTVFARTNQQDTISLQKSKDIPIHVQLNQQTCRRSSDLAHFLPCQAIHQNVFQIMDEGPAIRRGLLDWGLFHVKPCYLTIWKDYRQVLKQRNALLRQKASQQACAPWNRMLVELSYQLDALRAEYVIAWSDMFQNVVKQLTDTPCAIRYYKGWDKKNTGKNLATILDEQFVRDSAAQYTHSGAHHADILFDVATFTARQSLSRGQQKIILIALKLAQTQLLNQSCVYLFDDVAAELDTQHLKRLMAYLSCVNGQFFFTTTDDSWCGSLLNDYAIFYANSGCFT